MSEQRFGKVIARGDATQIALVKLALDECVNLPGPSLQDRLTRDYAIEFKTPLEMVEARVTRLPDGSWTGAIIPGSNTPRRPKGIAAEGYVFSPTVLWVNAKVAARRPPRARHIVRHEISHILPLTEAKKAELMALMEREDGTHPTQWRGSYVNRPEECHADTLAEAMSGKDSPWDDFEFFGLDLKDADLPKFIEITFRPTSDPVITPPPPPPLPPPDPVLIEAQARVAELEAQLAQITPLAEQIAPIALSIVNKSKAFGGGSG